MRRTLASDPICVHKVKYELSNTPKTGIEWCNTYDSPYCYLYTVDDNNYKLSSIFAFENEQDALMFKLVNGA